MKNKQSKGLSLSLSVNPKHSISERFKASTHGFCHFLKKFESAFRSCHYRACPDNLDPRDGLFVTPEDDKGLECLETAESGVDKVVSSCEKNPNCT